MNEHYFLIASEEPQSHGGVRRAYDLAATLAQRGREVTVFLVQNGVIPARRGPASASLEGLISRGAQVLADEFSLRERGIDSDRLASGVRPASLLQVTEALAAGAKVLWH